MTKGPHLNRYMPRLRSLYASLVLRTATIFFIGLSLVYLVARALYASADYPYFKHQHVGLLALIILMAGASLGLYSMLARSNIVVTRRLILLVLGLAALLQLAIVLLLPLQPFSDMADIQQAAQQISHGNFSALHGSGYAAAYPNNLLLVLMSAALYKVFGTASLVLAALHLLNIGCVALTTLFAYKIFKKIQGKDNLFVLLALAFFPPALLYANHLYTDVPAAMLFTDSLWFYLRDDRRVSAALAGGMLLAGTLLRPVGVIYLAAVALFELLLAHRANYKKLATMCLVFAVLLLAALGATRTLLVKPNTTPVWSYIYMAFNPEKFGFNDGTQNIHRTPGDVSQRLQNLGTRTAATVVVKKVAWQWTEGTYGVQRYSIGLPQTASYTYATPFTHGSGRQAVAAAANDGLYALNAVFILFTAAYLYIARPRDPRLLLLLSIALGFLLFYIFWEIKSRYLYSLYPVFIIFYALGLELLISRLMRKITSGTGAKSEFNGSGLTSAGKTIPKMLE